MSFFKPAALARKVLGRQLMLTFISSFLPICFMFACQEYLTGVLFRKTYTILYYVQVFSRWKSLEYLTLENIIFEDVPNCLKVIGHQLKGLKIQCSSFDLTNVAIYCPNLESLIIQKEKPSSQVDVSRVKGMPSTSLLASLKHLEVTCQDFPVTCFTFIAKLG